MYTMRHLYHLLFSLISLHATRGLASSSSSSSSSFLKSSSTTKKSTFVIPDDISEEGILTNSKWVLAKRPEKGEDFQATKHAEFLPDEPVEWKELYDDHIIIQTEGIGVDAFIRTVLDSSENAVHGGFPVGATIPAVGYGTIISSPIGCKFKKGDRVLGFLGAQSISIVPPSEFWTLRKVRPFFLAKNHPSYCLNLLGISGMTAYIGINYVLKPPQKGETVVVSAAAGAAGCYAAQLAKLIPGTRVVGIAGGSEKCEWLLSELGLDAAVDYKDPTRSVDEQLKEACPDGIDFYFDNVGGPILDSVLGQINRHARIVICGAISQYSEINHGDIYGPSKYIKLAEKSSQMAGFVTSHYEKKMKKGFLKLLYLVSRKKIKSYEHVFTGIDSFGEALEQIYQGKNIGKIVVDVKGDMKQD